MSSASTELAKYVLMVCGIILALGTSSAVLAQKLKMPDVVVFLVIGILLGPGVAGVIDIEADSALKSTRADFWLLLHPLRRWCLIAA